MNAIETAERIRALYSLHEWISKAPGVYACGGPAGVTKMQRLINEAVTQHSRGLQITLSYEIDPPPHKDPLP